MENTKDLPRLSTRGPVAGDLGRRPGLGRSDPSGQAAEWDAGPAENELQGRRGRATSCSATGPSPHWAAGDPADGPPSLSCSLSAVCCCSGGWNGWPGAAARWADSEGSPDIIREPPHERNGLGRLLGKIEEAPAAGQQPCQHGQDRPIGPGQPRCPYLPLEQGHLVRRIKISASLAPPDPASKTSQPNMRSSARLASRIDASTDSANLRDWAQQCPIRPFRSAQVTRSTAVAGDLDPGTPVTVADHHLSGEHGWIGSGTAS